MADKDFDLDEWWRGIKATRRQVQEKEKWYTLADVSLIEAKVLATFMQALLVLGYPLTSLDRESFLELWALVVEMAVEDEDPVAAIDRARDELVALCRSAGWSPEGNLLAQSEAFIAASLCGLLRRELRDGTCDAARAAMLGYEIGRLRVTSEMRHAEVVAAIGQETSESRQNWSRSGAAARRKPRPSDAEIHNAEQQAAKEFPGARQKTKREKRAAELLEVSRNKYIAWRKDSQK